MPSAARLSRSQRWILSFGAIGVAIFYLVGPIDFIPATESSWGHCDELGILAIGAAAAWLLMPSVPRTDANGLTVATRRLARDVRLVLRWLLRNAMAVLGARLLFRIAAGSWPARDEAKRFVDAFRRPGPLPPVLRGLASVPSAEPHLTRAMLSAWLQASEGCRDHMIRSLGAGCADVQGDRLRVWTGPRVAFLHIQKTGGSALVRTLESRCHPLQRDIDRPTRDALRDQVLQQPEVMRRIRRSAVLWGHHDLPTLRRLDPNRFVFTLLRDPARRVVSLYAFLRSHDILRVGAEQRLSPDLAAAGALDFAAFLRCGDPAVRDMIESHYIRMLLGRWRRIGEPDLVEAPGDAPQLAREALSGLNFVGITERMDTSVAVLRSLIDVDLPDTVPRLNDTDANQRAASPTFRPIGRVVVTPQAQAELARLTRFDRELYEIACGQLSEAASRLG